MAEPPKSSAGVEKSASLKNLDKNSRSGSPSGKPPSQLNKNPSQKAGEMSPLNVKGSGTGENSQGSSIRRNRSKRGSAAGESVDSPTKRKLGAGGGGSLGEGRQATKVANR